MSKKLSILALGALAASLSFGPAALADGPSGSTEDGANNVTCGAGTETPTGATVYAGTNGVEVCNDDQSSAVINGRAIVSADGYATADGANDNTGTAYGYARVDGNGVTCGSEDPSAAASGAEADNAETSADNDATAGSGDTTNCTD